LYRLFMSAILCMAKSVLRHDESLISLGPNTFLVRTQLDITQENEGTSEMADSWRLAMINTQLLSDGQTLAFITQNVPAAFKRVSTISSRDGMSPRIEKPSKVLLAVSGQYARYNGGYTGSLLISTDALDDENSAELKESSVKKAKQWIWQTAVTEWLAQHEISNLNIEAESWIEVELPLCAVDKDEPQSPEGSERTAHFVWKPILWPASLCFVNTGDDREEIRPRSLLQTLDDPLRFVQDWATSAADRESALKTEEEEATETPMQTERIDHLDGTHNNIHFDASQYFRRVTSLDGQAAAAIYPTPPDGMLSHVTPGVFPGDGIAATPGEGTTTAGQVALDMEMVDPAGVGEAIGSGLYDEDLFDDVPGEKFGEAEMADEPNWDFFDEPDVDMMQEAEEVDFEVPEKVTQHSISNLDHTADLRNTTLDVVDPSRPDIAHTNEMETQDSHGLPVPQEDFRSSDGSMKVEAFSEVAKARAASPPLSPADVRKKLFPNMAGNVPGPLQQKDADALHRRSLLDDRLQKNDFQPDLRIADDRYSASGLFWFDPEGANEGPKTKVEGIQTGIPVMGLPRKKPAVSTQRDADEPEPPSPSSSSPEDTDFDSSEFFSDHEKNPSPGKRDGYLGESIPASPEAVEDALDADTESKFREEVGRLLDILRPEINEQDVSSSHRSLRKPSVPTLPVTREDFLTVAQVLVDQVSQGFFDFGFHSPSTTESLSRHEEIFGQIKSVYKDATELGLHKLAEVCVGPEISDEDKQLVEIPSPFIRIARGETELDALPTIQPFWETLGLQPVSGKKNIAALCIYPSATHVQEGSVAFLQRLSDIYATCNLGSHTTSNLSEVTGTGLFGWEIRRENPMLELLEICERLGTSLNSLGSSAENVMIYVVNPFPDRSAVADICGAFVSLYTKYAKVCGNIKRYELNLQIIPLSFIASADTVVVPSQGEYLALAFEIYNRCPPTDSSVTIAASGAAVTLAPPTHTEIAFSRTPDATSPLSKGGESLHLAYTQSIDKRWITACWTDKLGNVALTMTYCLRQKGSSMFRPRSDVIKEMWETSFDIMSKTRGQWRLFIARDGPIEPDEINEWTFLSNQTSSSTNTSQCILTLLTFNITPSIQFFPPSLPPPQSKQLPPTSTTAKYGTPVSTPQAIIASSPEQPYYTASTPLPPTSGLLTAPTPPDQSSTSPSHQPHAFPSNPDTTTDPDATLLDPTDDCWSLTLNFGLNNSHSPLEARPALLSGFLLKRRGPMDSDGVVALGVNLIHTSTSAPTDAGSGKAGHKDVLRDIIAEWRGLYNLSKTKGLATPREGVLPWHVRTAVRGCEAVADVL
jgi:mediator of RNA polymerase II transcription subunit 13, fungi type